MGSIPYLYGNITANLNLKGSFPKKVYSVASGRNHEIVLIPRQTLSNTRGGFVDEEPSFSTTYLWNLD